MLSLQPSPLLLVSTLLLLHAQGPFAESDSNINNNANQQVCSNESTKQTDCSSIPEPTEKNHSDSPSKVSSTAGDNGVAAVVEINPDGRTTIEEEGDEHDETCLDASDDDYEDYDDEYEADEDDDEEYYDEDDDDGGDSDDEADDEEWDGLSDEDTEYYLALNIWGKPQIVEGSESEVEAIVEVIHKSKDYMVNIVMQEEDYAAVRSVCRNYNSRCSIWAAEDECDENWEWMLENCAPACLACKEYEQEFGSEDDDVEDEYDPPDEEQYDSPESSDDKGEIVPIAWGVPQVLGVQDPDKVLNLMEETAIYMTETVYVDDEYDNVFEECENRSAECSLWAVSGECEKNPDYMKLRCAPACGTCEFIDFNKRCPIDPDAFVAWPEPGDVNRFFERIVNDTYWEENHGPVTILSSPATGDPWVITIDNFLRDEEIKRLIEFGHEEEFERSTDVGELEFDGSTTKVESTWRTSENAWCPEECRTDPATRPAHDRIEKLTGIPYENAEWWQLLRYTPGQYYMEHNDYIIYDRKKPQGPRILTGFMYLNDVEAGGGTRFTTLDLTVMPKKGRAVFWPSVRDDKPFRKDKRTNHEALVVEAGIKFGANVWIHQRDFKTRHREGCI